MGLVLGMDYGNTRMGVAIADDQAISVRPLTTLPAHKGLPDTAAMQRLIDTFAPSKLVVGVPVSGGAAVEKSRRGAHRLTMWLHKHFALPVANCDESYSSVVVPRADRDAQSACVILRQWLEQQNHSANA